MAVRTSSGDRDRQIRARRELHELAHLFASTYPPLELERTLCRLHPDAADKLPVRELKAIVALVASR